MALAQETPLLLLDEPTTYPRHPPTSWRSSSWSSGLTTRGGRTIVMVLHDINEAARVSHQIVAMRDGEIIGEGTPDEVIRRRTPDAISTASSAMSIASPITVIRSACRAAGPAPSSESPRRGPGRCSTSDGLQTGYGRINVLRGLTCADATPARSRRSSDRTPAANRPCCAPAAGCCGRAGDRSTSTARMSPAASTASWPATWRCWPRARAMPPAFSVEDLVAAGRIPHQGFFRQWRAEDEAAVNRRWTIASSAICASARSRRSPAGSGSGPGSAMALAQDTPVLLLDEPTTFLDMAAQIDLLDLARDAEPRAERRRGHGPPRPQPGRPLLRFPDRDEGGAGRGRRHPAGRDHPRPAARCLRDRGGPSCATRPPARRS